MLTCVPLCAIDDTEMVVYQSRLEPIILSHHYWPGVADKRLKLPRALRRSVELIIGSIWS